MHIGGFCSWLRSLKILMLSIQYATTSMTLSFMSLVSGRYPSSVLPQYFMPIPIVVWMYFIVHLLVI